MKLSKKRFQSLIGRLKTDKWLIDWFGGGKFQSLIGRLKTKNLNVGVNLANARFNPL